MSKYKPDPFEILREELEKRGSLITNQKRDSFMAQCPAHEDGRPSMSIRRGDDDRVLLHCFAGCTVEDVCSALGLATRDLFVRDDRQRVQAGTTAIPFAARTQGGNIVYQYPDGDGQIVYEVERHDRPGGMKTFMQFSFDEAGSRVPGLKGIQQIPYGLPELLKVRPGGVVHITEGEKDTITLRERGILAVSLSASALRNPSNANWFRDLNIVVHADNDEPGRDRAHKVAETLCPFAASVRLVHYPELPEKGDVTDFLEAGNTIEALIAKCKVAPLWGPNNGKQQVSTRTALKLRKASAIEPREIDWLWSGWLPAGMITLLGGYGGSGKSTIALTIAAALSVGGDLPDGSTAPLTSTLVLAAEDAADYTIVPRLTELGANLDRVIILEGVAHNDQPGWVDLHEHIELIEAEVRENNIGLIIIDPISSFIGAANSDREADVRNALMPVLAMAERTGAAVLLIRHLAKGSDNPRAASRILGSTAWTDVPRVAWLLHDAPDDHQPESNPDGTRDLHRVLGVVKSNLAAKPQARWGLQPADGSFRWLPDASPISIEECFASTGSTGSTKTGQAEAWLTNQLSDGPVPTTEIEAAAKEAGITLRTLKRVRGILGVQAHRHSDNRWWLHLPETIQGDQSDSGGPLSRVNGPLGPLGRLDPDHDANNGSVSLNPSGFTQDDDDFSRARENCTFGPLDEKNSKKAKAAKAANPHAHAREDSTEADSFANKRKWRQPRAP